MDRMPLMAQRGETRRPARRAVQVGGDAGWKADTANGACRNETTGTDDSCRITQIEMLKSEIKRKLFRKTWEI